MLRAMVCMLRAVVCMPRTKRCGRQVREMKLMHEAYKARAESFDYKESSTVTQLKEASASAMREADR